MAAATVRVVFCFALRQLARVAKLSGRIEHGWRVLRGLGERRGATQLVNQQSRVSRRPVATKTAGAGHHGDILYPIDGVAHRPADDARLGVRRPDPLAGIRGAEPWNTRLPAVVITPDFALPCGCFQTAAMFTGSHASR